MTTDTKIDKKTAKDSGPFTGVRSFLTACMVLLIGVAVAHWAFTDSNLSGVIFALYISVVILAAIGGLWFIDVILSYLKS